VRRARRQIPRAIIAVKNGDALTTGNMSVGPGAGYNIATKRLYIAFSGNNSADYQFFAEIPVATARTTTAPSSRRTSARSSRRACGSRRRPDCSGSSTWPAPILAGFLNNDVWLSEPFIPHAWPARNRKSVPFGVVALGSYDRTLSC
jgi:hypothetical protein